MPANRTHSCYFLQLPKPFFPTFPPRVGLSRWRTALTMSSSQERSAFSILQSTNVNSLTNQVAEAVNFTPGPDDSINDIPKILWPWPSGRRFVLEGHIHRGNSRGRRTWIKAHGWFLTELRPNNTELETFWVCGHCANAGKGLFYKAQSTSNPIEHLRRLVRPPIGYG